MRAEHRQSGLADVLTVLAPRGRHKIRSAAGSAADLLARSEPLPCVRFVHDLTPTVEVGVVTLVSAAFKMCDRPRAHKDASR
jgi:hypothetical protein